MTHRTHRIHTLLIAFVALALVAAFPGSVAADNPWVGPWVSIVRGSETIGEAVCNVTWKLSGKNYNDTISCTLWDESNDKLVLGLTVSYFSGGRWIAIGSTCWNTTANESKRSCAFTLSRAPLNYGLRMVMQVKQGSKVLATPSASIDSQNVPNRK